MSDQASFHDLNIASHYCDEILYLRKGLTAGHGTLDAVFSGQMISRVFGVDTQLIAYPSSGRLLVSFNTGESAAPLSTESECKFHAGVMVMLLIAIPGLYFMVGRFLVNAWKKRHVWYAVTDRHELILQRGKEPPTRDFFDSFPAFEPHDVTLVFG